MVDGPASAGSDSGEDPGLRIGTSGWHYAAWWGPFYPETVQKKNALPFYATRFDCTELNAPFYRTPTPAAVEAWRRTTPLEFRFAWKASRYLTHFRRLAVEPKDIALLQSRLELLGKKAGPVLFQLPPHMHLERLARFLDGLGAAWRITFEFRHSSWYTAEVFDLLHRHNVALCLSDHAAAPAPTVTTADWIYVRNHGPGGRYHGNYSDHAVATWAHLIAGWRKDGRDVWCFFDNDVKSAAPTDAARLRTALEEVG